MTSPPSQARRTLVLVSAMLALYCSSSSTNEGGNGAGGAPAVVRCGSLSCDAKLEKKCCFSADDAGVTGTECAGNCPAKYTQSTGCDDRSDCVAQGKPDTFCCAHLYANCSDKNSEACIESAQCAFEANCAGDMAVILCDPAAKESCPGARNCASASGSIHNGVCGP